MFFDTTLFTYFFVVVFVVYWLISRFEVARLAWLLAASYAFYASWNIELLSLIVFSTMLDYFVGAKMHAQEDPKRRKALLMLSLGGNLGLLFFFKYGDFFLSSLQSISDSMDAGMKFPVLDLVLPVGISFYTFQTLSYTIDIYRGKLKPAKNLMHFALFVAFFPQLVAGPIVRARDFIPQLDLTPKFDAQKHGLGLFMMITGLVKKACVSDYLSVNLVDRVFENPAMYSSMEVLMALYGYSVQIYCDFSGYSDIAIGAALLIGFQLAMNFDRPYQSENIQEYWRRWHITLSTWLRDYLYIPLGGNRHGEFHTYKNLFLTMLLGGLWHGAAWTYVVWGAMHGAGLAFVRGLHKIWKPNPKDMVRKVLGVFITFQFINAGWILFRASSFQNSREILDRLLEFSLYTPNITPILWWLILGSIGLHLLPRKWYDDLGDRYALAPAVIQGAVLVAVAVLIQQVRSTEAAPFIYFQF